MIDILEKIATHKRKEVAEQQANVPIDALQKSKHYKRECLSAKKSIVENEFGIIAEFKRFSPSKPNINLEAKVEEVVPAYQKSGAAAVSILTDKFFFGGDINYLSQVRTTTIPLLRKDFIIDSYQIHEAKAYGADFILLIAAILSKEEIIKLSSLAKHLGLETLLEFHAGEEFEKLVPSVDMVGINNRNLRNFTVDINHAIAMRNQLKDCVCIAESGIHSTATYLNLKNNGFDGFLIGEYFMKHEQPDEALKKFIKNIETKN